MTEDKSSRHCHMAFISMSLGIFVLVCSAVIAGTLLSTAFNDKIAAEEVTNTLTMYEDIGNIMFALGDELVSSMAVTSDDDTEVGDMIVAQKITNKALSKVKENSIHHWTRSASFIMDEVEERKDAFREFIAWNEPLSAIKTYIDLSDWIFENSLDMDYAKSLRSEVSTFIIFVKGMCERFGELSLGILHVKTDIPVNGRELLSFRIGSKETMQMAFSFAPQGRSKLEELQTHAQNLTYMVVEDVFTSKSLKGNREFSEAYTRAVKEETAGLFLARQLLHNTLNVMVKDLSDRAEKTLYFNMTIVIVSVAALILCLIFSVITRATIKRQMEPTTSREIIYQNF